MTNLRIHISDWLFHYNGDNWEAIHISHITGIPQNCITSPSLMDLVQIMNKTNGEKEKLNTLVDGDGNK